MKYGILAPGLVVVAFEIVRPCIELAMRSGVTKCEHLAVVVTATEVIKPWDHKKSFKDNCYLVDNIGNKPELQHDCERVALSNAEKSVRTGKGSAELQPHYLFRGDTVHWGSVVLDDIVVACSGVQPCYDEMFSMWIASAVKAQAKRFISGYPSGYDFIALK